MARPAMRDPAGRWSLAQIAAAAGIPRQVARSVAASGYIDATNLGYKDIPLAKVAAALTEAPRPTGLNRADTADAVLKRNYEALALARRVIDDPTPPDEAIILVTPTTATFHKSTLRAAAELEDLTTPALVLPIGKWVTALNRDLLSGMRAS